MAYQRPGETADWSDDAMATKLIQEPSLFEGDASGVALEVPDSHFTNFFAFKRDARLQRGPQPVGEARVREATLKRVTLCAA